MYSIPVSIGVTGSFTFNCSGLETYNNYGIEKKGACAVNEQVLYLPSLILDALCLCFDQRVHPVVCLETLPAHLFLWRTVGLERYLSLVHSTPVSLEHVCVHLKGKVNINHYTVNYTSFI